MIYLLCLLIGITAGLRAATPIAAISIGAWLGWIDLGATWAGFLGNIIAVIVLVIFVVLEIVGDKLPQARSRKLPPSFVARVVSGALAGALLGLPSGNWIAGLVAGGIGGVIGTLGGYEARRWLAGQFKRDLPAALIEDAVAVVVALLVVYAA
jgi:uncharacterized membrane protein